MYNHVAWSDTQSRHVMLPSAPSFEEFSFRQFSFHFTLLYCLHIITVNVIHAETGKQTIHRKREKKKTRI